VRSSRGGVVDFSEGWQVALISRDGNPFFFFFRDSLPRRLSCGIPPHKKQRCRAALLIRGSTSVAKREAPNSSSFLSSTFFPPNAFFQSCCQRVLHLLLPLIAQDSHATIPEETAPRCPPFHPFFSSRTSSLLAGVEPLPAVCRDFLWQAFSVDNSRPRPPPP